MKRFSKISIDDIKNIQVDSGVLLKEFDVENPVFLPENVICATNGGINPVCEPEYYDFGEDVDNAKSAKETKRIRGWNVSISFTTFTTSLTLIRLALGAADVSGKVLSLRQRLQYAKDFKDIWWVGKRVDGVIVAIKLIRSLSDSGFSLQTRKGGKGQISVTLKGHSSFAEPNKIPMEVYIFAENDIPILPDEPDTPTASMYLYGRPSESGNIGLRNGESVTYYNGVVVKPVSELYDENYPIVCVTMGGILSGIGVMMFSNVTPYANGRLKYDKRVDFKYDEATHDWVYDTSLTDGTVFTSGIVWTNTPLYDTDGNLTHNVSDPIPVYTGMVGYSYNGAVLPDIYSVYTDEYQEQYPYVVIWAGLSGNYRMVINSSKPYLTKRDGEILLDVPLGGNRQSILRSNWSTFNASTGLDAIHIEDENGNQISMVIWANCEIKGLDGSTYLAASDPIPVYE